jgi:hypothetical protein
MFVATRHDARLVHHNTQPGRAVADRRRATLHQRCHRVDTNTRRSWCSKSFIGPLGIEYLDAGDDPREQERRSIESETVLDPVSHHTVPPADFKIR